MKLGIETEYLFKWIPHPNQDPIFPSELYLHFQESLHKQFQESSDDPIESIPLSNGGDFSYEAHPLFLQEGLLESSTPILSNPRDALCYQRAMEELIRDTADQMEESLGQAGTVKIIKNSQDRLGHTYGCQENYEVSVTQKGFGFRTVQVGLLMLTGFCLGLTFLVNSLLLLLCLPVCMVYLFGKINSWSWAHSWDETFKPEALNARLVKISYQVLYPLTWMNALGISKFYDRFVFAPFYHQIQDYVITRLIFASSGHLHREGHFVLSERAMGLTNLTRQDISLTKKPLFESGHIYKQMILAWTQGIRGNFQPLRDVFQTQQRIQVCFSDANRCDVSEYVKFGVTSLLVEMAHKGEMTDLPKILHPMEAIRIFSEDLTLSKKVPMSDGIPRHALEIQRLYQKKLTQYLSKQSLMSTANHDLNQLWAGLLENLSHSDHKPLFGLIDWITKEKLLSLCQSLTFEERKKIDLSYHDLREGPFALLEKQGFISQLVEMDDIIDAMSEPPDLDTNHSQMRSSAIKTILDNKIPTHKKPPVFSFAKKPKSKSGVVIPLFPHL